MESSDRKIKCCYICDKETILYCKNIFELSSKHSETPIYKILEKFMGLNLKELSNVDDESIVCQNCLSKIDEYDLAYLTAQKIEKELTTLLIQTQNKHFENEGDGFNCEEANVDVKYSTEYIVSDVVNTDVLNESPPVIMKCTICTETFGSLNEMQQHNHTPSPKNYKRRGRPRKSAISGTKSYKIRFIHKSEAESKDLVFLGSEDFNDEYLSDENFKEEFQEGTKQGRPKNVKKGNKTKSKQPHKCNKCCKEFLSKTEYKLHMKTHEDLEKQVCDICGITYKSKSALEIHVGMHNGLSPFECAICCKKFTQKGALVRHMPIHTGERPYQCDKCGKQFLHYSSFHMHQLAHDNIREKKCSICGLELRSNSHLTRHMRVHSGEKPYSCPSCGQKFAQRYNMMTHFKAHQGIHRVYAKNHVCPVCNATFSRKLKLEEHLATIHATVLTTPNGPVSTNILAENKNDLLMSITLNNPNASI